MGVRLAIALVLVGSVLLSPVSMAQGIDASPQWQRTLEFDVSSSDTVALGGAPSWAVQADGDIVVATRASDFSFLLRRLRPDGSIRHAARASVPILAATSAVLYVRVDAGSGDTLVMAGSELFCGLQRFDANLVRRWSITLPADPQLATCMDFAVYDDGSVAALQHGALTRVDANGVVVWTVRNGDDGRYLAATAMVRGNDDTIWIAGRGDLISQGGNQLAVQRFRTDGLRLPADSVACAGCVATTPGGIARRTDGDVVVVGSGSGAQRGIVLRYAANGERRYVVDRAGPGYRQIVVDDMDNLFARASNDDELGEVHRLDAGTGAVLWARPARDLAGLDTGVAVTQAAAMPDAGLMAARLDTAGEEQWRQAIPGALQESAVSRMVRVGARLTWLVQGGQPVGASCRRSPRLASMAAIDGSTREDVFCDMPAEARAVALDAVDSVGSLLASEQHLVAHGADGTPRWQIRTCALCVPQSAGYTIWASAVLRMDGGAWAIEAVRESSATLSPWTLSLRRIGADGTLFSPFLLGSHDFGPSGLVMRRSADDGVVVLRSITGGQGSTVVYHVFDAESQQVGTASYPMPDSSTMVRSARALADGVAFVSEGVQICGTGCDPVHVGITRIAVDGSVAWQYGFGKSLDVPEVALQPDGSASALMQASDGTIQRRRINAEGTWMSPDVPVPGIDAGAWIIDLSPVVGGRQTAVFRSPPDYGISMLDESASVIATRAMYPQMQPFVAAGALGFLTNDYAMRDADAEMLSAQDLHTTVRFRVSGSLFPDASRPIFSHWSALDSGAVYGATTILDANGARQLALARFNVPGSSADRLFANGFD